MSAIAVESIQLTNNPLDILEEIVAANDWPFDRSSDDELIVEIEGRWCDYRLFFVWQTDISAMQFSCQFDMTVPTARRAALDELLGLINVQLWLGHFDVPPDENTIMFRQTMLFRGARGASVEQLEDLVEIALSECERYFPAFQFVLRNGRTPSEAVSAAILDTLGEA